MAEDVFEFDDASDDIAEQRSSDEKDVEDVRDYDLYLARQYVGLLVQWWLVAVVAALAKSFVVGDPWIDISNAVGKPAAVLLLAFSLGACLSTYHGAFKLAIGFAKIVAVLAIVDVFLGQYLEGLAPYFSMNVITAILIAASGFHLIYGFRSYIDSKVRITIATVLLTLGSAAIWHMPTINQAASQFVATFAGQSAEEPSLAERLPVDTLWESQPRLIETATRTLPVAESSGERVYLLAIAPYGIEDIFSREAKRALTMVSSRYDQSTRMKVLLSNDSDDVLDAPLATNGNVERVLDRIVEDANPAGDLLVIYITSHGAPDGTAGTNMFDYSQLEWLGATRLRKTLDNSGFRRRLIIVSACYAGSWIKPLANDDTIVLTAARADRTSFGCSDQRELTLFGEALLERGGEPKDSLEDIFTRAKAFIAKTEKSLPMQASEPQVSIGKNMMAIWKDPAP